ncbi:uncharacterized protein LOC123546465 [Mercenaria mercenaria]|uniref:uncharacterized protein LOC123546465 n=1 Tax=Mercenaria mercenaria TaxID=6596 RepID=UPI001E1D9C8E|nr:uncharacterized protein LOC123546465 [Mercenaria mercenaria]
MSAKSASRTLQISAGLLSNHDADLQTRALSPVGGRSSHVAIEMHDVTTNRSEAKSNGPNDVNQNYDTSSFTETNDNADINGIQTSQEGTTDNGPSARKINVTSNGKDRKDKDGNEKAPPRDSIKQSLENQTRIKEDSFQSEISSASPSVTLPGSAGSGKSTDLELPRSSVNSSQSGNKSSNSAFDESEYYCVDHMKLCSTQEAQDEHANCEFLVPAFEWAEAQTMERDRRNIEEKLKKFETFAGTLLEDRNVLKKQLIDSKEDVAEEFLDIVEDLIAHLLTKQKEFMSRLDELHGNHMKTIDGQIRRCMHVQKETSFSIEQLNRCTQGSDEFKRIKRNIIEKCPVYEEILRRDFNNATRLDYEFRPDPWVDKFFKSMNSLGDVIARPVGSKLPGFLSQSTETDFSRKELQILSRNDGVSGADTNSCCFSGCTFVYGGKMILTDWNNSCLKMFNKRGVLCDRLILPNNPWDVKLMDDDRVVVTVPGEQKIFIVCFSGQEMQVVSSFDTDCECWAVAVVGDRFATTCDPWSKTPSIKMFTMAGKYVAFYQKDNNDRQLFAYPEHITTDPYQSVMYVSDSRLHTVIALTVEGCLMFRYKHRDLIYPSGVAVDNQGYLYICGKESQNVHQVSKRGQVIRILMDANELEAPRAICVQPDGETLIVTDVGSSNCDEFITAKLE